MSSIVVDEKYIYLVKELELYFELFYDVQGASETTLEFLGDKISITHKLFGKEYNYKFIHSGFENASELVQRRLIKRYSMQSFYNTLKTLTGKSFPYGAFVGIRPTKLFYQLKEEYTASQIQDFFINFLDFDDNKYQLVKDIVETQERIGKTNIFANDLYISIPFCKGRCSYCSFFSCDIEKNKHSENAYINALICELKSVKDSYNSIYIGGGTPSAISIENIKKLLEKLRHIKTSEFTFEAGRPESITNELLDLLAENGITRISINPQTTNENTLRLIGRKHNFEDILNAYERARKYSFSINMDLIMGLDTYDDFRQSLIAVESLKPENITVHSLALKKGSLLKEKSNKLEVLDIDKSSDFAYDYLTQKEYAPYYLYRQKYSAGNLENVGYTKKGVACKYNINNMEERTNIDAYGANAISKIIFSEQDRIERKANPKDINTYIKKITDL